MSDTSTSLTSMLSANYMLGRLKTGSPSFGYRMKDKEQQLAQDEQAASNAFAVRTRNVYANCAYITAPASIISACKSWFDAENPPWAEKTGARREAGPRLVATASLLETIGHFGDMQAQFQAAIDAITPETFEADLNLARSRVGYYATEIDWPTREEIIERYVLDLQIDPLPAFSPHVALPAAVVDGLQKLYDRREQSLAVSAFEDRKERLLDALRTLHDSVAARRNFRSATYEKPLTLVTDESLLFMANVLGKDRASIERFAVALEADLRAHHDLPALRQDECALDELRIVLAEHIQTVEGW